MKLRFQKRIRILPWLTINLNSSALAGKVSGSSVTVGVPGLGVNVNNEGVQGHLGAPGTGLGYRTKRVGPKTIGDVVVGWFKKKPVDPKSS